MAKINIFQKWVKEQFGQGQIYGTMWKFLSQGMHVHYESPISCSLIVMAKVNNFKSRSNFKVKVTR